MSTAVSSRTTTKLAAFHPLGPRNSAVTLNPAISADAFDAYMDLPTAKGLPGWINITSKDDWATGTMFRIASTVGVPALVGIGLNDTLFSPARGKAIGHFAPYQTHQLFIEHQMVRGEGALFEDGKVCGKVSYPNERGPPLWFRFSNDVTTTIVDPFVTRIASVQIGVALMAICPSFRVGTCMETRASGFRVTCGILRPMKMLSAGISYIRSSPQSNITHTFRQTCFACWLNWFSNAEDAQNRHFDLRMN